MDGQNKMRNIANVDELVRKTYGIGKNAITLKKFNITEKAIEIVLDYEDESIDFKVKITADNVSPQFTMRKANPAFVEDKIAKAFYLQGEFYRDEEINDEFFQGQAYDPARGYVDEDEVNQASLDFETSDK